MERHNWRSMKGFAVSIIAASLLAGCSTGGLKLNALSPGTQTATYNGVMLSNVSEIYRQADAYCSAYNKNAQMLEDGVPDGTITFACLD